jgi:hypothetical protein
MLNLSVALNLFVSLGMITMGIKYIRATPPMDYHAEIMKADKLSKEALSILGALYKAMGGGFFSLGVNLVILTLFGVWNDILWAKFTILVGALIAGSFATLAPRKVEQVTGVKTPWRIPAALTALAIIAFVVSIL